ncbi:eIF4 binding protein [Schizosaccharomyces japonicus yFS275]|uniref:EIF4 binding protein n=1 Tax=Schizosaccharomyces japonicus (strain yFS275 / FY16936) TaxID=402676 RepID=B6K4M1_SCHJY|nr:eIF4 binding protein [Schizosaccharomyces japonicus yFS275]EEB08428.1 eIF4 binding protein [Schizosaccharomyces japonicus yFS275]
MAVGKRKSRAPQLPKSLLDELNVDVSSANSRSKKQRTGSKDRFQGRKNRTTGYFKREHSQNVEDEESEMVLEKKPSKSHSKGKSSKEQKKAPLPHSVLAALEDDDKEIAFWEKKLGVSGTAKSSKVDPEFGWILEDLGADASDSLDMLEEDMDVGDEEDVVSPESSDEGSEALTSDSEFEGFSNNESEDEVDESQSKTKDATTGETSQVTSTRIDPLKPAVPAAQTASYVPPFLRKKAEQASSESEEQIRLRRKLQGFLNRLSSTNMGSIIGEIEGVYRENPRHLVTDTLTKLLLQTIASRESMLDQLVIVYAALGTALYRVIGIEFGAHLLQSLVERFLNLYRENGQRGTTSNKGASNLSVLIVELYNFQLISCVLIYDLVRLFLKELNDNDVELLLKILRNCGHQLRSDDPHALQDIINEVQNVVSKKDPATVSVRTKFMVETIINIKSNKAKVSAENARLNNESVNQLKKFLSSLNNRSLRATEPLRVSLDDIENVETKGKWWLVGASWKTIDNTKETQLAVESYREKVRKEEAIAQSKLLQKARKLRLNTDVRRNIFIALMGAEDYMDAWDRIEKLNLKNAQQPEIAYVLMHCVGSESSYNPFYSLVALRFCLRRHNLKKSFQFALWDFFNELQSDEENDTPSLKRVVNLARFFAALTLEQGQPLTILKKVDFMVAGSEMRTFLIVYLNDILVNTKSDIDLIKLLEVLTNEKALASKLEWFLKKHVRHNPLVSSKDKKKLEANLAMARAALQSMAQDS